MRLKRTFGSALARLTGERAASLPPDDPAFQALCLNLSHILQQPAANPKVSQAAAVSWRHGNHSCGQLPEMVWPAVTVRQLQQQSALIVIPPAGCSFCPSCIGDGITGYLISPHADADAEETLFCGSPARIWLSPIAEAVAANRPVWFGWLADTPVGSRGDVVEIFTPTAPRALPEVITDLLHRTEAILRAFPDQCVADRPFWSSPFVVP